MFKKRAPQIRELLDAVFKIMLSGRAALDGNDGKTALQSFRQLLKETITRDRGKVIDPDRSKYN